MLCNNAALGRVADEDNGDPMELALLRAGRLAGLERGELLNESPEVVEHAFDTSTNMMATVHRRGGVYLFAVKGAPEAVLAGAERLAGENSDAVMDEATRAKWLERVGELGEEGLRVLAFAALTRSVPDGPPFQSLTFLGLAGLEDPPRSDVPDAIRACQRAGIRVVMITGDHAVTARSIARAVGLGAQGRVVRGRDLAQLAEVSPERLLYTDIFARVSPDEKLQLVRAHQAAGEIVAVTGDGVNDAPALRQADIGVAMGLRGTDVAREAAAMILLNDAFPTIVAAIREGRVIFGNIRRFVAYLLSCNLCEVFTVGVAVLFGLPLPLLPLQILFLNLVTDVFPAFALAMGEGEADVLNRPPRDPKEPILGRADWLLIVLHGVALTAATFGALALAHLWLGLDERAAVTVTFLTLAFAQLWHVFNMRHKTSDLLRNEITCNPWIWGALAFCAGLMVTAVLRAEPCRRASCCGAGRQDVDNYSHDEPRSAARWPVPQVPCEQIRGQPYARPAPGLSRIPVGPTGARCPAHALMREIGHRGSTNSVLRLQRPPHPSDYDAAGAVVGRRLDAFVEIEDELRHVIVPVERNDRLGRQPATVCNVDWHGS